jgi:hypothetical protein
VGGRPYNVVLAKLGTFNPGKPLVVVPPYPGGGVVFATSLRRH